MTNAALVQVLNTCNQLSVQLGSLGFLEPCVSDNEIEQLTTVSIFHYLNSSLSVSIIS